jgi:hypothetical protein
MNFGCSPKRTKGFWRGSATHRIQNALIEAFCTHARNLNEFFLEVGWDHALKASDFTLGDYQSRSNTEERKALIAKINKQISHPTDQRTLTPQEKIAESDRTVLYQLLVADFKNFTQHLRPELRPIREVLLKPANAYVLNGNSGRNDGPIAN